MELLILDIIISILQSILFAYSILYCVDKKYKEEKLNKVKLILIAILFSFSSYIFTKTFGDNEVVSLFVIHIITLLMIMIIYRKNILNAIIAYSIIYAIMLAFSIIFGSLIFESIKSIFSLKYINYEKIFIIYAPGLILLFYCFKYIDKIKQIYTYIINEHFSIVFIIITFFSDFIMTFYILHLGEKSQITKNIINIIFFIVCLGVFVYISKIYIKSEKISKLNKALELKNNELRKIKHDYGAQISYLYGLCLMERFNDLKQSLKDIINTNDSIPSAVEINESNNSIISLALKPALDKGIHVIVDANCDIGLCIIPEIELYRVLSNIVNNAISAMNYEGIIIVKAYEQIDHVVIKIANNGPKINEEFIDKIFQSGFTTKENDDKNHGFGLSIVKELIEKYSGKILLKSNDISTEFKIILPIRQGNI